MDLSAVNKATGEEIEGIKQEKFNLDTGAARLNLPGLVDGIVGMKTGETREVPITMPNDWPQAFIRGVEATFTVTLRELFQNDVPEATDAVASKIFSKMRAAGVEPDEVTYGSYFAALAYCQDGRWDMAADALAAMRARGAALRRSHYIYKPLLVTLAKEPSTSPTARDEMLQLVSETASGGFFDSACRTAVLRAPFLSAADKAGLPTPQEPPRRRNIREGKPRNGGDVRGGGMRRQFTPRSAKAKPRQ